MRFAHLADCHIGSWREQKLNDVSTKAFEKAIDVIIEKKLDFVLIAGDLFNNPLPQIDKLKRVVIKLKQLKDESIKVYAIPGSHDFSPSGKTMIDVLESAGLLVNVCKGKVIDDKLHLNFTIDDKTGAKITGMIGKKGMLDKKFYEALNLEPLEKEGGYKIFLFHTLVTELKPKDLEKMDSQELSIFPKGFNYYAGGHPHIVNHCDFKGYTKVCYPGPLFPNSFSEIEKLGHGGFFIVEDDKIDYIPLMVYNTCCLNFKADHKNSKEIETEILNQIKGKEFFNTIVTIRVEGILESGKRSDIDFTKIFTILYDGGAYFVMKSTSRLETKEYEEIKVDPSSPIDIEDKIIMEHIGQMKTKLIADETFVKKLMNVLSAEKLEGEKVTDFEKRVLEEIKSVISL